MIGLNSWVQVGPAGQVVNLIMVSWLVSIVLYFIYTWGHVFNLDLIFPLVEILF